MKFFIMSLTFLLFFSSVIAAEELETESSNRKTLNELKLYYLQGANLADKECQDVTWFIGGIFSGVCLGMLGGAIVGTAAGFTEELSLDSTDKCDFIVSYDHKTMFVQGYNDKAKAKKQTAAYWGSGLGIGLVLWGLWVVTG